MLNAHHAIKQHCCKANAKRARTLRAVVWEHAIGTMPLYFGASLCTHGSDSTESERLRARALCRVIVQLRSTRAADFLFGDCDTDGTPLPFGHRKSGLVRRSTHTLP